LFVYAAGILSMEGRWTMEASEIIITGMIMGMVVAAPAWLLSVVRLGRSIDRKKREDRGMNDEGKGL
jgi:hypothetical protein